MKKILVVLFLLPVFAKSQDTKLMIQGAAGNLYLRHTTAQKENFYSIGRLYNISPREIAPYNNLVLEKGLSLGKEIKIPLTSNFTQSAPTEPDEAAVPLYHKAAANQTLTLISNLYNKVSFASLREWNNLKTDVIAPGQDIIVGFLKVKKDLSAYAQQAKRLAPAKEELKTSPVTTKETVKTLPMSAGNAKSPKQTPIMKIDPPVTEKKAEPVVTSPKAGNSKDMKGDGAFKSLYADTGKEEGGMAGIFKSTSGREDAKYYCLQNTATPGTVVRVTNPATGKAVYAKVLDMMPDLKQNTGLVILLSDAAADALGSEGINFTCTIHY